MDRFLSALESFVFRKRGLFLCFFISVTAWMLVCASRTHIDASFTKQLPLEHPYIRVFSSYQAQFGGANRVLIAVMAKQGDIFTPEFFNTLKAASDEVFFLPGVDRSQVQSIFTPNVRYVEVVEEGFVGGPVVPAGFTPTPEGFATVRDNLIKSGKVGQLVANDFSGALISAQLLEIDPATGKKTDYIAIGHLLETHLRQKFTNASANIHIIGFAKIISDVSDGARGVLLFFALSFVITGILVRLYSHSFRLTFSTLACALVAVIWQMGLLNVFGFGIDPFSILVPFLVFAIAVSHAVQMVRAHRSEIFAGLTALNSARSAFRQLLIPGGVALLTDTIGFLTLLVIKIETIQELAITASLGVAVILVTNLFLLPILLSYQDLHDTYRRHILARRKVTDALWRRFCVILEPRPSILILAVSGALALVAFHYSKQIKIGDIQAGQPELRQNSRYNTDSAQITRKFSIGVDVMTVFAETLPNGCVDHDVLVQMDQLEGALRALPSVQSVVSVSSVAKFVNSGWNEGSPKWRIIPRSPAAIVQVVSPIETATGLLNSDGSVMPIQIFLTDHKAETLRAVSDTVKHFSATFPSPKVHFSLAGGNAGIMAATNEVVQQAQFPVLLWVFGAVIILCQLTFRSWRATVCIIAPLALVSWLAYAVMVWLGIGLKTSTLPVVALGVGIGVDYGIYIFAKLQASLVRGDYFEDALYDAFTQTGSAVVFTGLTLAIGVATWVFSDLKFQADMGILLTFLFLVNMLAAIVLLPAMARWLFRHHVRGTTSGER